MLRRPDHYEQYLIQWYLDESRNHYEPIIAHGPLYIGVDTNHNVIIKTKEEVDRDESNTRNQTRGGGK